ncbi:MAG TPA: Arm DNA-binding domain-containing protein [Mucilaginibacter sp.]|nr:Arm DNA-binding domain-containing protein [Mucilaginibacter sp.]
MIEKTLGLLFYLKKPKNYIEGAIPIYFRITVDGISKELSSKRSWHRSRWNKKTKRALGYSTDSLSLNQYLDVLQNKAFEARQYLIEKDKSVDKGL